VSPKRSSPVGKPPESGQPKLCHFFSVVGWPVPFYTDWKPTMSIFTLIDGWVDRDFPCISYLTAWVPTDKHSVWQDCQKHRLNRSRVPRFPYWKNKVFFACKYQCSWVNSFSSINKYVKLNPFKEVPKIEEFLVECKVLAEQGNRSPLSSCI